MLEYTTKKLLISLCFVTKLDNVKLLSIQKDTNSNLQACQFRTKCMPLCTHVTLFNTKLYNVLDKIIT